MPGAKKDISLIKTFSLNVKKFGLYGAFNGTPIKVLMTIIGWAAVSLITQQESQVPDTFTHKFKEKPKDTYP